MKINVTKDQEGNLVITRIKEVTSQEQGVPLSALLAKKQSVLRKREQILAECKSELDEVNELLDKAKEIGCVPTANHQSLVTEITALETEFESKVGKPPTKNN